MTPGNSISGTALIGANGKVPNPPVKNSSTGTCQIRITW